MALGLSQQLHGLGYSRNRSVLAYGQIVNQVIRRYELDPASRATVR